MSDYVVNEHAVEDVVLGEGLYAVYGLEPLLQVGLLVEGSHSVLVLFFEICYYVIELLFC
jgi:hypothetical protein